MDLSAVLAAALLGLLFGSFAAAASRRLVDGIKVVVGRSACRACGHALSAIDLVPVLSWLASRGRCRHCGGDIGWRYPVIELATAALFVLIALVYGRDPAALLMALLAVGLVIVAATDLEHRIIPDAVLLALVPPGLMHRWLLGAPWWETAAGLAAALAIGLAVRAGYRMVRRRDGLGGGDVKFLGVAGLWLGLPTLPGFLVLTGLLGIAFGPLWHRRGGGPEFPFAPSLAAALLLCLLFER